MKRTSRALALFMGVFLALGSVFFAVGNLAAHSSDLTGFLWNMGYLWMLLTPVLTMRAYAGEQKSRTDQLLLTAPVSLRGIVLGKYLAGCAVLLLTVLLSHLYALAIALWGKLYLGEMLCGFLGFVLQGCAFLAIDFLISARCRTPVTAAVWAFGVNLMLWLVDVVSSAVSVGWITKSLHFISLYMRAEPFQEGQLSLANLLFFLAVIALSLFLTVRTLDARRWSGSPRRTITNVLLCLLAAAVAVAAVIVGDLWEERAAGRVDLSFNRVTTQSAATDRVLQSLDKDVHAYVLSSEGNTLNDLNALLDRYQAASPRFTWSSDSLSRNPLLMQWVSDDVRDTAVSNDCVIVRCADTGRTRVLTWDDYMQFGYSAETGDYAWTGLTYEQAVTSAIVYVSTDTLPRVQLLAGHGELTASETAVMESCLAAANYEVARVNLRGGDALDAAAPLMILSPVRDIDADEAEALADFAKAGGSVFITADFTDPEDLPNLYAFYRLYGVLPRAGLVLADADDPAGYYSHVAEIVPTLLSVDRLTDQMVSNGEDYLILAPARALQIVGEESSDLVIDTVLQSRAATYLKQGDADGVSTERADGDPSGPFPLAVFCDRAFADGTRSWAFFAGNSGMFMNETLLELTASRELLSQVIGRLAGDSGISLDIAPRQAMRPALNVPAGLLPVALLVLPALLIAILAAVILLPRRYL